MRCCLLSILAMGVAVSASAQAQRSTNESAPVPPFFVNAPQVSRWNIAVTYKRAVPEPADKDSELHAKWQRLQKIVPAITEIQVYKSGNRRREITFYAQGVKDEKFTIDRFEFLQSAGYVPGDVSMRETSRASDFPELDWIGLDNYKGIQTFKGKKCYVFAKTAGSSTLEAWIDFQSKLPVKFNDPVYDRVYEFSKSSSDNVKPSAVIEKRVESYFGGRLPPG